MSGAWENSFGVNIGSLAQFVGQSTGIRGILRVSPDPRSIKLITVHFPYLGIR
jgi:hypothetical protein